jgi:CRISPR-associated exonuclease Cas4
MIEYNDEELLMLSGIQHIAFCERQWALIHIEQQWAENVLTVEGKHMHEKVDNPMDSDLSKNEIVLRSVSLVSRQLGLYGISDVVELSKSDISHNSIKLVSRDGYWKPIPVEYKRGKPKPDACDEVQLCAQCICLEEMYSISISYGYLYYGETRHRHEVEFTEELRLKVKDYCNRMHELYNSEKTPPPVYKPHCNKCSLINVCLPKKIANNMSVNEYLNDLLNQ